MKENPKLKNRIKINFSPFFSRVHFIIASIKYNSVFVNRETPVKLQILYLMRQRLTCSSTIFLFFPYMYGARLYFPVALHLVEAMWLIGGNMKLVKIVHPLPSLAPKIFFYYLVLALSLPIEQPDEEDSGRFSKALGNSGATGWREPEFLYAYVEESTLQGPYYQTSECDYSKKKLFCKATEILWVFVIVV